MMKKLKFKKKMRLKLNNQLKKIMNIKNQILLKKRKKRKNLKNN